nr:MAG TPA: hypothetical protein [Bacteriophage sp.]
MAHEVYQLRIRPYFRDRIIRPLFVKYQSSINFQQLR